MEFITVLIKIMSGILVFSSFYILYIFILNRSLLNNKNTSLGIFIFICFILGYLLEYYEVKGGESLKIPLLQFLLYKFLFLTFVRIYKREPLDTFWTMDKKLIKDGVFNFIFWILGGIIPVLIVFNGYI